MRIIVCLFISLRILQCSYSVGSASVSDEEFRAQLREALIQSGIATTSDIARSGHRDAIAVLKLMGISDSRYEIAEKFGVVLPVGKAEIITPIPHRILVKFLTIAGDEEAFEEFIRPIEEVIGLPEIGTQQQARMHSTIRELGKRQVAAAIPYFAALLYYDDSEIKVIQDPNRMFHPALPPVSTVAAETLHRMLRIPEIEKLIAASEDKSKTTGIYTDNNAVLVTLAKKWWQNNSSKYGVEDPDSIRAIFGKAEIKSRRAKSALQFDRPVSDNLAEAETSERIIDTGEPVDSNKGIGSSKGYWLAAVALLASSGLAYLYIRRRS